MTFEQWCEAQVWDPSEQPQLRDCWNAAVAAERERWAAICRAVMDEHGGDPAGQLVDYGDHMRLVKQCQAAGASQVLLKGLAGPNVI